MENLQTNPTTKKWYKLSIVVSCILLVLAIAWAFFGLLGGSIVLTNTLPGNVCDYDGWLKYIFGAVGVVCFIGGLIFGFKGASSTNIKSYKVSSSGVRETSDGCMAQLMAILIIPPLMAFAGYAFSYYLVYLIVALSIALLPFIVAIILLIIAILFLISMWHRMDELMLSQFILVEAIAVILYVVIAVLLSRNVDVIDTMSNSITTISESFKKPKVDPKTFVLTKSGIGSLQFHKPFNDMSDSEEGLYNRVEIDYWEDDTGSKTPSYTLYWDDELVASFSYLRDKHVVSKISLYSKRIELPNGLRIGMPLKEGIEKGLKAYVTSMQWEETDWGYDIIVSLSGNLFFHIDGANSEAIFTNSAWERILKEMNESGFDSKPLKASDFASTDVVIASVGLE